MTVSLGLDLSLTGTGLVLLQKEKGVKAVKRLVTEQVPYKKELGHYENVTAIAQYIQDKLAWPLYRPDIITIEGYGQGSHGGVASFVKVVEVGTMVKVMLWGHDYTWAEVPPQSLKKFVANKGGASKKEMCDAVAKHWGYHTKNHNIADAYGLAMFGLARAGAVSITPDQVDAMDRVKSGQ